MSSVLVTGASGFIGSHLCDALLRAGENVVALDDLSWGRRENIAHLSGHPRFRFIEESILDAALVHDLARSARAVVHLAAQVSVPRSFDDPLLNERINGEGFLNCLLAAGQAGCELFLYASSCAVYGDNSQLPLGEGSAVRPLSPYAVTKLMNEHCAAVLAPKFPALAITGMRFFNIFGPRQDAAGGYAPVIPRWIQARMKGGVPVIFGDGSATRDFCYVGNVADLVSRIVSQPPRPGSRIVNVGTGVATSLMRLDAEIRAIAALKGYGPDFAMPRHEGQRQGDILHSVADIGLLRRELDFEPRYSLEDGLAIMYDHEVGTAALP
jgi:UDP-N-acetylglucosamine 4-epimerase